MGNCNKQEQGSKPSKKKESQKEPVGNIVVMTFAGQNYVDLCLVESQPPTFSDPKYFRESHVEISTVSDTSIHK
jgi:hypothetical protein